MSLDKNIENAFYVVRETYKNVHKLFSFIDEEAIEYDYVSSQGNGRFLRYRSDPDPAGWLTDDFVKIYQYEKDLIISNEWRDGPTYLVVISFAKEPKITVGVATYDTIPWETLNSSGYSWMIVNPLNKENENRFFAHEHLKGSDYSICKPINDSVKSTYKGLNEITYKEYSLSEVTAKTVDRIIFEEFEKLREITLAKTDNV